MFEITLACVITGRRGLPDGEFNFSTLVVNLGGRLGTGMALGGPDNLRCRSFAFAQILMSHSFLYMAFAKIVSFLFAFLVVLF